MIPQLDTESIRARPGSRLSDADARDVAPSLFELERKNGVITAEAILADARDPDSPLHRFFEWDDSKAAEQHRLNTARTLARAVVYRVLIGGARTSDFQPALVRVSAPDAGGIPRTGYVSIARAMDDDHLKQQVLASARREMELWIRRYRTVEALANVIPLAEQLHGQIGQQPPAQ